jgi:DNA polymerase-1
MPIQGTAADVVKKAMIAVDQWVCDGNNEEEVEMLLQVHDELLFEIKKEKAKEFSAELKNIMETVVSFHVPLVVDIKIGPNWEEMKKEK